MPFWTVPNITDSFWKRFGIVMLVKSHTHSIYVMFIWFHRLFESNGPFSQFNAEFIAPKEYDQTHGSILVMKISLFQIIQLSFFSKLKAKVCCSKKFRSNSPWSKSFMFEFTHDIHSEWERKRVPFNTAFNRLNNSFATFKTWPEFINELYARNYLHPTSNSKQ